MASAILLAACVGQEKQHDSAGKASTAAPGTELKAGPASADPKTVARLDDVRILAISPAAGAVLRVGEKMTAKAQVAYTLKSAPSATVWLVIQDGNKMLVRATAPVQKGTGTVTLTQEFEVPDTKALQAFTPLIPDGATSTTVADGRAWAVQKK